MKRIMFALCVAAIATPIYPCLVRTIINNSTTTDMVVRNVLIRGARHTSEGVIVPRRDEYAAVPRKVDAHDLGVGAALEVVATEATFYGKICKSYRIVPDLEREKLLLQQKDGCRPGWLVYETIQEFPMDPDNCFIDIYLEGDANSLNIRMMNGNDISVHYPQPTNL